MMLRKFRKFILLLLKFCIFNRHWCCINEQPITTVTETKIEYATHVVATKTKVLLNKKIGIT